MPREGIDLYKIGTTPEELQYALMQLRADFDAHTHDGASSRSFETIVAETVSARVLLVRKTSYADTASGIWMGEVDGIMRLKLGSAASYLQWDGTTLSIVGSITATTGTIGGFTIGSTTITGGTLVLSSAGSGTITGGTIRTSSGTTRVEMDGANNALYLYQSGNIRVAISNDGIAFNTPAEVSSGAIYGFGTSTLAVSVGDETYYFSESGIVPDTNGGPNIGGSSSDWFNGVFVSGGVAFKEGLSGNNYMLIQGPNSLSSNLALTLPDSLGSAGEVLYNSGSGILDWREIPAVYYGYVESDGDEGTPFPSGWSSSNDSTGVYTVTHNLGTSAYSVVVVPRASTVKDISVSVRGSNSFTVRVSNLSDTLEDNDFMFILAIAA